MISTSLSNNFDKVLKKKNTYERKFKTDGTAGLGTILSLCSDNRWSIDSYFKLESNIHVFMIW